MTMRTAVVAGLLSFLTLSTGIGTAVAGDTETGRQERLSAEEMQDITIDQKLDSQVPLDLTFTDEKGAQVRLGDLVKDRPVVLTLVYYECPMLCTQVLNGLLKTLNVMEFSAGDEFDIVTVSIDPDETPAMASEKKKSYIDRYDRAGAGNGWHFLTGDGKSTAALAGAVGFRYVYDSTSDQYAHASAIMVLTPEGKVSAYQFGIEYSPKDLRLSLVQAAEGKVGSPVDQLILLCYQYDPLTGSFAFNIRAALRIGAVITVLGLGGFVVVMVRRDKRKKKKDQVDPEVAKLTSQIGDLKN